VTAREHAGPSHIAPPVRDYLDRLRFPADDWKFTEAQFSASDLGKTETLFALGNGYLGMRGNVEEGRDTHSHGTFINGFHETWPIQHAEEAFGFARVGQTIVNVPDAKVIRLYVDDELLKEVSLDTTVNEGSPSTNPFREPHYIILNLAIGANGGDPSETKFPGRLEADYVRVSQKPKAG